MNRLHAYVCRKLSILAVSAVTWSIAACGGANPTPADPAGDRGASPTPTGSASSSSSIGTPEQTSAREVAMVILIQGNGYWMGNETYYEGDDVPHEGAFTGLGPAIDELAQAGPLGSRAAVLFYGNGRAEAKHAMEDIALLNGSVLGLQEDHEGILDFPLLIGLEASMTLLDEHPDYRRILVIIGDGLGEREDIREPLATIINGLQERQIEAFSIFYDESGTEYGLPNMEAIGYTGTAKASSREDFAVLAREFARVINTAGR